MASTTDRANHSLAVGDVDNDGKDEIIYGSATFDDNGTRLYTTGLGHGDALHFSDLDPSHPGLEVFQSNADVAKPNAIDIHGAGTGEVLWSMESTNRRRRPCRRDGHRPPLRRLRNVEHGNRMAICTMFTATSSAPCPAIQGPCSTTLVCGGTLIRSAN